MQWERPGFDPWVGKTPWRREQLPPAVFWPGEFHSIGSQSQLLSNFLFLRQGKIPHIGQKMALLAHRQARFFSALIYAAIKMAESLHCSLETSTTLFMAISQYKVLLVLKTRKIKKKKRGDSLKKRSQNWIDRIKNGWNDD